MQYWRIMNTPKPLTMKGTMIAVIWPRQPNHSMSISSGMIPICTGTAMVSTTPTAATLRPLKRSLARENPASEEKNTTESATAVAEIVELSRPSVKLAVVFANRRSRFSRKFPPGHR